MFTFCLFVSQWEFLISEFDVNITTSRKQQPVPNLYRIFDLLMVWQFFNNTNSFNFNKNIINFFGILFYYPFLLVLDQ